MILLRIPDDATYSLGKRRVHQNDEERVGDATEDEEHDGDLPIGLADVEPAHLGRAKVVVHFSVEFLLVPGVHGDRVLSEGLRMARSDGR